MMQPEIELSERDRLFFLHIPKTAGTSLAAMLADWMGGEATLLYTPFYAAITADELAATRYLRGHCSYSMGDALLGGSPVRLTVLRNPVERWLSGYGQLQYSRKMGVRLSALIRATLDYRVEELATPELIARFPFLWDRQVQLIGDEPNRDPAALLGGPNAVLATLQRTRKLKEQGIVDQNDALNSRPSAEALARAIERLDTFAWLGITERMHESLMVLCYTFGWPYPLELARLNVRPERPQRSQLAAEVLEQITAHHQYDMLLYQAACQLMERRFMAMQHDLLQRFGSREHANLALPLPTTVLLSLLEHHYRSRFRQRHVPRSSLHVDVQAQSWRGSGWHHLEYTDGAQPFRWMGPLAEAFLDLPVAGEQPLVIDALFVNAIDPALLDGLRLHANGTEISLTRLPSPRCWRVSGLIPTPIVQASQGMLRLHFSTERTIRPADVIPDSGDTRQLSIAIGSVQIEPIGAHVPEDADALYQLLAAEATPIASRPLPPAQPKRTIQQALQGLRAVQIQLSELQAALAAGHDALADEDAVIAGLHKQLMSDRATLAAHDAQIAGMREQLAANDTAFAEEGLHRPRVEE